MPTSFTLNVDHASNALSTSLIGLVQDLYGECGYPEMTITQAYVASNAVHVGLNWWILPQFISANPAFGSSPNQPTFFRLTPTVQADTTLSVEVADVDADYAQDIANAIGREQQDVLGCALCTGLAMLAGLTNPGVPDGTPQVGPFLNP